MNPYEVLGVPRTATTGEIKKAYRTLARNNHPDKNPGVTDDSKIKEINEAYALLSDPSQKEQYDQFGGTDPHIDLSDIFSNIFFGPARPRDSQARVVVRVTLAEVLNGGTARVDFRIHDKCSTCDGLGTKDPQDIITCAACDGCGFQHMMISSIMATRMTCSVCMGKGKSVRQDKVCKMCSGTACVASKRVLDVRVPIGIPDGMSRMLPKKGSYVVASKEYEDVQLVFEYVYDKSIMSVHANSDVSLTIDVGLKDILNGFQKTVELYNVEKVFATNGYVNPGRSITIPSLGLPVYKNEKKRGNLHININVVYPDSFDVTKLTKAKKIVAVPADVHFLDK